MPTVQAMILIEMKLFVLTDCRLLLRHGRSDREGLLEWIADVSGSVGEGMKVKWA
jgi:hypothetical protein